jgi:hypothetical protein
MPDFIRSGVASAMNSNSSPVVPAANASSNESSGTRDLAAARSGSGGRHGPSYRPHSVTQVVSFNVGRALGRAAGGNNAENNYFWQRRFICGGSHRSGSRKGRSSDRTASRP